MPRKSRSINRPRNLVLHFVSYIFVSYTPIFNKLAPTLCVIHKVTDCVIHFSTVNFSVIHHPDSQFVCHTWCYYWCFWRLLADNSHPSVDMSNSFHCNNSFYETIQEPLYSWQIVKIFFLKNEFLKKDVVLNCTILSLIKHLIWDEMVALTLISIAIFHNLFLFQLFQGRWMEWTMLIRK